MNWFTISQWLIKWFYPLAAILLTVSSILVWNYFQTSATPDPIVNETVEIVVVNEPIQPIPLEIKLNEAKVKLGEQLFYEPQLSGKNQFSCATCHNLAAGGVDGLPRSRTGNGEIWAINTPTVFNSMFNFKQNWSGSANNLEQQIERSIYNPKSMNSNWDEIISKLQKNPEYVQAFKKNYPDGLTSNNIKDAIATFERSLITPNSRFDQFLLGNSTALNPEEQEGYRLFKAYGCVSCHQGINIGGNMFQAFGVIGEYFNDRGDIKKEDLGRFNVTKDERDRYVFKVPSLRNTALTAPYFHDGSATTLEAAVAYMAQYQLGRQLTAEKTALIVKFLKTTTGEYKGDRL